MCPQLKIKQHSSILNRVVFVSYLAWEVTCNLPFIEGHLASAVF